MGKLSYFTTAMYKSVFCASLAVAVAGTGCGKTVERTSAQDSQFAALESSGASSGSGTSAGSGASSGGSGSSASSGSSSSSGGSASSGSSSSTGSSSSSGSGSGSTGASGSTGGSSSSGGSGSTSAGSSSGCSSGCCGSTTGSGSGSGSGTSGNPPVVCDPMGGYGAPDSAHGLKGSLWYIPPTTQSRYATVADIDKLGVEINASLYLSDLDVRTRLYNTGFPTTAGNLLKAPDGSVLTEWFGMKLDTEIRLTGYDEPGLYQFALLADDGAIMDVKPTKTATGYTLLVNDDGVHPSELSCADTAIPMDRNSSIPVHIDYFQGPRNHIALMLLWRNLTDSHHAKLTMAESLCGRSGNGLFWDYTQTPSAPQAAWWQLRADYWSVVAARNYFLPGTAVNPCFAHY